MSTVYATATTIFLRRTRIWWSVIVCEFSLQLVSCVKCSMGTYGTEFELASFLSFSLSLFLFSPFDEFVCTRCNKMFDSEASKTGIDSYSYDSRRSKTQQKLWNFVIKYSLLQKVNKNINVKINRKLFWVRFGGISRKNISRTLKMYRCNSQRGFLYDTDGYVNVWVDGSCLGNGQPGARAGYGVFYNWQHHL